MKANGDLVGPEGLVPGPVTGVVDQLPQPDLYLEWIYADVLDGRTPLARPGPHGAEHPSVESEEDALVQHVALARERPAVGIVDTNLLGLVQFAPKRDVGRDQALPLFGRERRGRAVGFAVERVAHPTSHSRRGSPRINSSTSRSRSALISRGSSAWFSSFMV